MPDRILRVFPRRTTHTPDDEMVAIGEPGLFARREPEEVRVSCLFTWDLRESVRLVKAWQRRFPGAEVSLGGPATGDPGGPFTPGLYTRPGITISSRGCPNSCPWCLVPRREGKLRLYPIRLGHIVQDNNVLAWPRPQFSNLSYMLRMLKHEARFTGGLEAARLTDWHVDELRKMRIRELWFAADTDAALPALRKALDKFKDLPRRKKRCYVLAGWGGESVARAEARLEAAWEAGALPFVQLYRDEDGGPEYGREWRELRRDWSRAVMIYARHKEAAHA